MKKTIFLSQLPLRLWKFSVFCSYLLPWLKRAWNSPTKKHTRSIQFCACRRLKKQRKYSITAVIISAKPSSWNLYPVGDLPPGNNIKVNKRGDTGKISVNFMFTAIKYEGSQSYHRGSDLGICNHIHFRPNLMIHLLFSVMTLYIKIKWETRDH